MKDDRVYCLHVRDAIHRILSYTAEGKDAFLGDRKTQDAVLRNLEVIGEAVKRVSERVKRAHPEIPWRRVTGMRDKVIHGYFGVDLRLIWEVVERDLPSLDRTLEAILQELRED